MPYRRESSSTEITRRLLDYLLSGSVELGQKIPPERQLAGALGVGRTAVREAIKTLSLLGLLDVRQGDGTYLSRSSSDLLPRVIEWGMLLEQPHLTDLIEAREEMEPIVARLAAERRSAEDVEALRALVAEMEAARGDIGRYVDADTAFHLRLAEAAGNAVFRNQLSGIRELLRTWAKSVLEAAGETESSLAMHKPILEAVERKDAKAAERAMTAHMERAGRRLREALGGHPRKAPGTQSGPRPKR
jgi:GntR family transcriptional repressor for pyruvate dehydrogenase complex